MRAGHPTRLTLRLGRKDRRTLRRRGLLKVHLTITARFADGPKASVTRALTLRRETGERLLVADSLLLIGNTTAAASRPAEARAALQAAYEILSELGHPDAEQAKAKLGPRIQAVRP